MQQMWDKRASQYDASVTFHEVLASKLVTFSKVQPGHKVLDIASGTGMVAIPLARLVGPKGSVIGIDISAEMIKEVGH